MRTGEWRTFACPNDDCDYSEDVKWLPADAIDPGCYATDPPTECPECGADMAEEESEPCDPFDMAELADAAYDRGR